MKNDIYESRDKHIVPYLLTQSEVKLIDKKTIGVVVYFQFTPFDKCEILVHNFLTRNAQQMQPKDLFDAMDRYKYMLYETKNRAEI